MRRGRGHTPKRTLGINRVHMSMEVVFGDERGKTNAITSISAPNRKHAAQSRGDYITYHFGFPQAAPQLYIFVPT